MTVRELMEKLAQLNPESAVYHAEPVYRNYYDDDPDSYASNGFTFLYRGNVNVVANDSVVIIGAPWNRDCVPSHEEWARQQEFHKRLAAEYANQPKQEERY
jgi:hypothetical protein